MLNKNISFRPIGRWKNSGFPEIGAHLYCIRHGQKDKNEPAQFFQDREIWSVLHNRWRRNASKIGRKTARIDWKRKSDACVAVVIDVAAGSVL